MSVVVFVSYPSVFASSPLFLTEEADAGRDSNVGSILQQHKLDYVHSISVSPAIFFRDIKIPLLVK